jgi:ribosome-associated protein
MSATKPKTTATEFTPAELAGRIAAIADAKQATDIVGLDVGNLVGYTDVMLICTARNERLAKAIHDEIHERLKHEDGLLPSRSEGVGENSWILLDYLDCIVHIFIPETRDRYRLDQLWGEAEQVELNIPDAVRDAS